MNWFDEALPAAVAGEGYTQRFAVTSVVYENKTDFQDLIIFDNPSFGRVLALDGIIQTTEKDEFFYHEMLAHVPIVAHGNVAKVLIIGGGDGGALREVLRHPIEQVSLVDIDRTVIEACRDYMPTLSDGAFEDKRTRLVIADGVKFVAECEDAFDVIIVDSTDPLGPGEALFSEAFYAGCRRCLSPGGVLITQNGVPFFQAGAVTDSYRRLKPLFADVAFYLTVVPTYIGGAMALGWASDDEGLRRLSPSEIAARYDKLGLRTRYYSPAVHVASFALPPFVRDLMAE